jgi:CopG family nickel-responsive transcriptional regulator
MPIVSVSLTDKNLEVLEKIQESLGLTGRSESIRACIRSAESTLRERENLNGSVEGILIILHDSHHSLKLDNIRHQFKEQVATQIHSHLKNSKCLEVFIVNGQAKDIKQMLESVHGEDSFEYVNFVVF